MSSNYLDKAPCLAAVCALVGCASSQNFQGFAREFPSQQSIEDLKQTKAEPIFRDSSTEGRVSHWQLTGPLPTSWGSRTIQSSDPVTRHIEAAFRSAIMTESMACAARETGLFYAQYQRYPFRELREFIEHRCGTVGSGAAIAVFELGDANTPATQIAGDPDFASWTGQLATSYDHAGWEFGVWHGSGPSGSYTVVMADRPELTVEPVPLDLAGRDSVVIEGEVLVAADALYGVATRGAFDYAECTTNTEIALPRFQIECPVDKADPTVALSIARGRATDVFVRSIAAPRFWLAEPPSDLFVATGAKAPTPLAQPTLVQPIAPPAAAAQPESSQPPELIGKSVAANDVSPEALRARFIEQINAIRATAGRKPLKLEAAQSEANSELVPYMVGEGDFDAIRNRAVLGALAGWSVNGKIINGDILFQAFSSADVDDIVLSIVASAAGRRTLLSEELDAAAVGSIFDPKTQTVGLAVTTYELLDGRPHAERVSAIVAKLARARHARGKTPPRVEHALDALANKLDQRVQTGQSSLTDAADGLMKGALDVYRRDTYSYIGAAHDPMRLTFDWRLLTTEPLRISVIVTPFKPKGSPWYVYGVVIAYPKAARAR